MTAKWVGDALGKDGIYSVWIAMRDYPWLPPTDFHDQGQTGAEVMKPVDRLVVIEDGEYTLKELGMFCCLLFFIVADYLVSGEFMKRHAYHGFPVVSAERDFVGYITRDKLARDIGESTVGYTLHPIFMALYQIIS